MTISKDKPTEYHNTGIKKIGQRIVLKPILKEHRVDQDTEVRHQNVTALTLPIINIDRITQDNSNTPYIPDRSFIDQYPTMILPVIQDIYKNAKVDPQNTEESYISLMRNLVKSSGIYAIASLTSPLVSLILAPFLTHNLSHTDYGALAVLNTFIALVAGITQLGLGTAFFRLYNYDYDSKRNRLHVLSTLIILLSFISIPISITIIVVAPQVADILLSSPSLSGSIKLVALTILLQNLTVPGFSWLRAENRAGFFSALSIVNLLIVVGVNIVLIGVLHMGLAGSILATGCGYGVIVVCTLPIVFLRAGLHLRLDITKGLLAFGLPNVSSFVSVWVLQLSDRYLLSRFGSLSQTASYAVAYSLGGVISTVIIAPFSLAWPSAMYSIAKKDDATKIFQLVFRWYSFLLLLAAYGLSLISLCLLNLFFPTPYHSASPVIPIIAASVMFYGIYLIFTIGISIRRKPWFVVIFTTSSALLNVGLNLLLIPHYGSIGAATSTLIAYAALALIAYIVNQRIYRIPFEIHLFLIALFMGFVLYISSDFLAYAYKTSGTWIIYVCAFCLYTGLLALLGKFPGWSTRLIKERGIS